MDTKKILKAMKMLNKSFDITVTGTSMIPTMYERDIIKVQPLVNYNIGDIIVFYYNDNELIVHRLLAINDNNYLCKGDNAFRLESVEKEQIIGKVIGLWRESGIISLPKFTNELISLSFKIHRIFLQHSFDLERTKETDEYKKYKYLMNKLIHK